MSEKNSVREIARSHPKYLIISADLLADLGNQFVQLTLLDQLIFKGERALSSLVVMCVLEQTPSIFLSPLAGLWIDRIGGKLWLITVNLSKCLLMAVFLFPLSPGITLSAYLCFIIGCLFFHIGRISLTPMLIPKHELISFNSLNERVSLAGRVLGPRLIASIVLRTGQKFALGLAGGLFMLSVFSICGLPKFAPVFEQSSHGRKPGGGQRPLLLKYRRPFRNNHRLKAYFCIFGFVLLGGGVLNIGLPILFKTDFGGNIADWGMIMFGFQAGSCLAAFLLPRCPSTLMHQIILSSTFLALAGAMAILGQLTTYIQIALLMILFGCGLTLIHIFLESLSQQNSERIHMGKTMSLLTTYRGACYLGTILISALVLRVWNSQFLLLTGSCLMAIASLMAQRLIPASPSGNKMRPDTK